MSKMTVFDEHTPVQVLRDGVVMQVMFCDVLCGDVLCEYGNAVVDEDAHISGDASYEGWLFHDTDGNGYFPEDFAGD